MQVATAAVSPCVCDGHVTSRRHYSTSPVPILGTYILSALLLWCSFSLRGEVDYRGGFQSIISLTYIYWVSMLQPCRWARTKKTKSVFSTVRFVRCWGENCIWAIKCEFVHVASFTPISASQPSNGGWVGAGRVVTETSSEGAYEVTWVRSWKTASHASGVSNVSCMQTSWGKIRWKSIFVSNSENSEASQETVEER